MMWFSHISIGQGYLNDELGSSGSPGTMSAYFSSFIPAILYAQAVSDCGFL